MHLVVFIKANVFNNIYKCVIKIYRWKSDNYDKLPDLKLSIVLKMLILKIPKNFKSQSNSKIINQSNSNLNNTCVWRRRKLKIEIYQKHMYIPIYTVKNIHIKFKVIYFKYILLALKLYTWYKCKCMCTFILRNNFLSNNKNYLN